MSSLPVAVSLLEHLGLERRSMGKPTKEFLDVLQCDEWKVGIAIVNG